VSSGRATTSVLAHTGVCLEEQTDRREQLGEEDYDYEGDREISGDFDREGRLRDFMPISPEVLRRPGLLPMYSILLARGPRSGAEALSPAVVIDVDIARTYPV